MTKNEALKLALEAMTYADACLKKQLTTKDKHQYAQDLLLEAGTAIQEALAQPEHEWLRGECVKCGQSIERQEPVAWVSEIAEEAELMLEKPRFQAVPLYTTPPKAQPEQETVAYQDIAEKCRLETVPAKGTLLHTSPPASKSWQGLTGEGIDKLADMHRKE